MSDAIRFLDEGCAADVPALGGKGAGLAFLVASGVRIPPAFVVTADGYREALGAELRREVAERLAAIEEERTATVSAGSPVRACSSAHAARRRSVSA
jgi:pyruvate,water dikinase